MELRHIRYFLAVAREGNFTRAAFCLGINQPPLSVQIKDLEREVGAVLFHRVARGAELTAAGQAFLKRVEGIPGQSEQAITHAQRAERGELGSLRVSFTASAAFSNVVPDTIRAFRRAHLDVELRLEESNTTRLLAGLHDSTFDVAFLRSAASDQSDLQVRDLYSEQLILALPAAHVACRSCTIDLAGLVSEPFLLIPRSIEPTLHDTIVGACRHAGFEPNVHQLVPQLSSMLNLVAAGVGVAFVPASMRQAQVAGVAFRTIDGEVPDTRLSIACRRGDTSKLIRNFMAVVISN